MVVSALEHLAYRTFDFNGQLVLPSSPLDHSSHHAGDFGLVDFVFGACACCLQQARECLNAVWTKPSRCMGESAPMKCVGVFTFKHRAV